MGHASDTSPESSDRPFSTAFGLLCGVGLFAIFSSTMSKSPTLPLFAQNLGASETELGFIAAASTYVGIILSIPAGCLSDHLGRRAVLLMAAVVFASAPVLYLPITEAYHLAAVRVYHGAATAIFGPVALAYVADLAPVRRGERMGLFSSATLVGRSLAPFASGFLLGWGFDAVYAVCGVAGVVALGLALALPRPASAEKKQTLRKAWRTAKEALGACARNRVILITSVAEAVQYLAFGAFETFLPLYAQDLGLREWQIGVVLGAQVVIIALTKPIMGRVSDQVGRRPVIAAGLLLGGVALALLPFSGGMASLLVLSALFGLSMSIVTASTSALVADASKAAHYGSSLGVLSTIMDVGHSTGPVLAGVLVAQLRYGPAFVIIGGLLAVAAVAFMAAIPARLAPVQDEA